MPRQIYAAIAALAILASPAAAQTAYTPPSMLPPPPPPPLQAPQPGTLSITRDSHAVDAYGNRTDSQSTTYRDSQGVASDRRTTTTTVLPPPPPVTTRTTTQTTTTYQQ